ncbi:sugar phosphate isomerase/epimerase family protein [Limnoglobus roseus]|uniref:Xylose isomerase-like TIM barrel n=1 Tax=Limnoglobus roseus TaxID=2598579 RepID=A0A5C1ACB6_9BACT|nr:TIM barrel protein [Limnoglobus roseus]QEL17029.1 xylose isomerase-like TIM barrel [Limnoglobus roseus]
MRFALLVLLVVISPLSAADPAALFERKNLVAWCIVPFDGKHRGPDERAAMMKKLGFQHYAYDWRDQHLPSFEKELAALEREGIKLDAVWFPASLDKNAKFFLETLEKHKIQTQFWVTMNGGSVTTTPEEQAKRVKQHADSLRPIAEAAGKIGCTVGLYNHGGWFGEPENQIAIIDTLKLKNVGIVYNLHHGHDHLVRFPQLLKVMKPHLYAVNLNGTVKGGDKVGQKILPLGQGAEDLRLLKAIQDSGYAGPIGIIGHTDDDAEERLRDNLDGLDWLVPQLAGKPAGPKPPPRTGKK